jgi:deaminated glutathione amidase
MISTSRVAAIQLSSQDSIEQNLISVANALAIAHAQQVDLVVLPENFACFAVGQQRQTAQQFEYICTSLQHMARQYHCWIIAGTLPCPYRPNGQIIPDGRVRATSLCIDPSGQIVGRYDKIHLFDVYVGDGTGQYLESSTFEAGNQITVIPTPFGHIGMMVCYDLRFPELAMTLRQHGAHILTAPSAFTYKTGQQHWELLIRSRAIDSQCIVIGANQQGWHGIRQTWGHSIIVDSVGTILTESTQGGFDVKIACYDREAQVAQRRAMPLMEHRCVSFSTALTKDLIHG